MLRFNCLKRFTLLWNPVCKQPAPLTRLDAQPKLPTDKEERMTLDELHYLDKLHVYLAVRRLMEREYGVFQGRWGWLYVRGPSDDFPRRVYARSWSDLVYKVRYKPGFLRSLTSWFDEIDRERRARRDSDAEQQGDQAASAATGSEPFLRVIVRSAR